MESCCFYGRKWCKSGKPPSVFCRIPFVAVLGKAGIAAAHSAFTKLFTAKSPMCITERAAPCHATPRHVPARPGRVRQRLECWGALAPAVRGAAAAPGTGGQLVRLAGRRSVGAENGCNAERSNCCFAAYFRGVRSYCAGDTSRRK